jgi:hypothetical protein
MLGYRRERFRHSPFSRTLFRVLLVDSRDWLDQSKLKPLRVIQDAEATIRRR